MEQDNKRTLVLNCNTMPRGKTKRTRSSLVTVKGGNTDDPGTLTSVDRNEDQLQATTDETKKLKGHKKKKKSNLTDSTESRTDDVTPMSPVSDTTETKKSKRLMSKKPSGNVDQYPGMPTSGDTNIDQLQATTDETKKSNPKKKKKKSNLMASTESTDDVTPMPPASATTHGSKNSIRLSEYQTSGNVDQTDFEKGQLFLSAKSSDPNIDNIAFPVMEISQPLEKVADHYNYDPPFSIYERTIFLNDWNIDRISSNRLEIFPVTGEQRKKQNKDVFDWLQPSTRPANRKAVKEAYDSNFTFTDGFQSSNKLCSTYEYCVPASVDNRVAEYETHHAVMDHTLCNIEEETDWLIKPVGNLINRINAAKTKPPTRSSLQDARSGNDIFLYSAYANADEFVSSCDDVELIDFVKDNTSKKIWHCSNVSKSMILSKAIIKAYKESISDDDMLDPKPFRMKVLTDQ